MAALHVHHLRTPSVAEGGGSARWVAATMSFGCNVFRQRSTETELALMPELSRR